MASLSDALDEFYKGLHTRERTTGRTGSSLVSFKKLKSDALAVHPHQVAEATEDAKKRGVPVRFDRNGRPEFTSSRQFRRYAKAYGFVHKGY